jgi:hypothetical protein
MAAARRAAMPTHRYDRRDRSSSVKLRKSRFSVTIRIVIARGDRPGLYTVELTTRQWQIVDGTMENEVSVEAENGDPRGIVDLGHQVRVAGWIRSHIGRRASRAQELGRRTEIWSPSQCPAINGLWCVPPWPGGQTCRSGWETSRTPRRPVRSTTWSSHRCAPWALAMRCSGRWKASTRAAALSVATRVWATMPAGVGAVRSR